MGDSVIFSNKNTYYILNRLYIYFYGKGNYIKPQVWKIISQRWATVNCYGLDNVIGLNNYKIYCMSSHVLFYFEEKYIYIRNNRGTSHTGMEVGRTDSPGR